MDPRTDEVTNRAASTPDTYTAPDTGFSPTVGTTGNTDDVETARVGVEQTRAEMSDTIDAIKDKLTPANLMGDTTDSIKEKAAAITESALDKAGEMITGAASSAKDALSTAGTKAKDTLSTAGVKTKDTAADLVNLVRANPIPAALIGLGLGMLYYNTRQRGEQQRFGRYYPTYDSDIEDAPSVPGAPAPSSFDDNSNGGVLHTARERASEIVGGVRDKVSGAAQSATGAVSNATHVVSDKASALAQTTKQTAHRAAEGSQQMLQDNPLMVGAIALAVGTVVGLLVPETEYEHNVMGPARDRLTDSFLERATETVGTVKEQIVQKVGDTVDNLAGSTR